MFNEKLDVKTREKWTQIHTNTSQVLNQVLRDRQFKEWEKRLKELEARGRTLRRTIKRLEGSQVSVNQTAADLSSGTVQNVPLGSGGS